MFGRTLWTATLALALGAGAAQAQIGTGGRGGFPGGYGNMGGRLPWRAGARLDIPDVRNPLRLIVDNKDDLRLTPTQAQRVDSMRRALDLRNDTLVAQIKRAFGEDSTALASGLPAAGPEGDTRAPDAAERAARARVLRDRLKVMKPAFEEIRRNDDQAWNAAAALLDKQQRKKAERIRNEDRKAWERARAPIGNWAPGGER